MKYKIVHGDDEDELTERVNESMQEGWVPQGGVMVLINTFSKGERYEAPVWEPYSDEWHQAMVKAAGHKPMISTGIIIGTKVDPELGW